MVSVSGALRVATLACTLTAFASAARGQESGLKFPSDPAAWLNAPPISAEMLKGKAALLYFYEET